MKHFAVLLFFLWFTPPAQALPSASGYELQSSGIPLFFDVINHLILVRASVDGREGLFLFDTGAANLTLNRRHFSTYTVDYHGEYQTLFSSSQACWAVRIGRFKWGGLQRSNFVVPVDDLSMVERKLGLTILGLIGYQVIRKLEIHFDAQKEVLTLIGLDRKGQPRTARPGKAPDLVIPFQLGEHLPLIQARTPRGRRLWLGIDSGATINVLDHSWKKALLPLITPAGEITIGDAAAHLRKAECVTLSHLDLEGAIGNEECRATFVDLTHLRPGGYRLDGLINLEMLLRHRVSINYRLREIRLWSS